jgi:hypothetical protein
LRVLLELAADARIFEALSAGVRFSLLHDTAPPEGVVATDLRLVNNLRLEL